MKAVYKAAKEAIGMTEMGTTRLTYTHYYTELLGWL